MPMTRSAIAAMLGLLAAPAFAADEPLRSGAYQVTYSLELPHVQPMPSGDATVCLKDAGGAEDFPVLSANNPLARCPVSKLRREGAEVSFEIACAGPNAAKAYALFAIRAGAFDGRIAMNMGGKNMTMTEVQHGARVGDCEAAATAPQ